MREIETSVDKVVAPLQADVAAAAEGPTAAAAPAVAGEAAGKTPESKT